MKVSIVYRSQNIRNKNIREKKGKTPIPSIYCMPTQKKKEKKKLIIIAKQL